jgi:hypothetical protein
MTDKIPKRGIDVLKAKLRNGAKTKAGPLEAEQL